MSEHVSKRQKIADTLERINDPKDCYCNVEAKEFVVRKNTPNKGRIFYGCGLNGRCKFFKWIEEYTELIKLSKYHPDEQFIVQIEMNRRIKKQHLSFYPIIKHPDERTSFFCVERDRKTLVEKMVNNVYKDKIIHYSHTLEVLDFHVDFRYESSKIYCVFGKMNWSYETEKRLQDLHKRGIINYDQVVKKINYERHEIDYDKIWIQLHDVRKNKKGWLIDGIADFIIFETGPNRYKHVKREVLKAYILKNCKGIRLIYTNRDKIDGIQLCHEKDTALTPYSAHMKVYKPKTEHRYDAYCYITKKELFDLDK